MKALAILVTLIFTNLVFAKNQCSDLAPWEYDLFKKYSTNRDRFIINNRVDYLYEDVFSVVLEEYIVDNYGYDSEIAKTIGNTLFRYVIKNGHLPDNRAFDTQMQFIWHLYESSRNVLLINCSQFKLAIDRFGISPE